jgi:plastocyanin
MRRIVLLTVLALAACEGEPPKVPEGAPPGPAEPVPTVAETPSAEAGAPAAVVTHEHAMGNGCGCACACAQAGDGGAEGGASVAAVPSAEAGAAVAAKATITGTLTTTPAAAAATAIVYLEDGPIEPNAKMSVTVDNSKMNFYPYVAVIPVGGKVIFHNSDPFPHNVFSPDGEKFNIGIIAANGGASAHKFTHAGPNTLLCNLHPGMIGYVLVSPSSYFARVDAKGHFAMKDVPAGTYKVSAWAPRLKTETKSATVSGSDVTLDFELHR